GTAETARLKETSARRRGTKIPLPAAHCLRGRPAPGRAAHLAPRPCSRPPAPPPCECAVRARSRYRAAAAATERCRSLGAASTRPPHREARGSAPWWLRGSLETRAPPAQARTRHLAPTSSPAWCGAL